VRNSTWERLRDDAKQLESFRDEGAFFSWRGLLKSIFFVFECCTGDKNILMIPARAGNGGPARTVVTRARIHGKDNLEQFQGITCGSVIKRPLFYRMGPQVTHSQLPRLFVGRTSVFLGQCACPLETSLDACTILTRQGNFNSLPRASV